MIRTTDYWRDFCEQMQASIALAEQHRVGIRVAWLKDEPLVRPTKDIPYGVVEEMWTK